MDNEKRKNPNISKDDLFKKTKNSADKAFEKGVINAIKNAQGKTIVCLDKNHPPNGIAKSIRIV